LEIAGIYNNRSSDRTSDAQFGLAAVLLGIFGEVEPLQATSSEYFVALTRYHLLGFQSVLFGT
jgi:hypothetical protein